MHRRKVRAIALCKPLPSRTRQGCAEKQTPPGVTRLRGVVLFKGKFHKWRSSESQGGQFGCEETLTDATDILKATGGAPLFGVRPDVFKSLRGFGQYRGDIPCRGHSSI